MNSTATNKSVHTVSGRMRMQSMDLLKFLAIFLVLWGHAEQYLLSCDYAERAVYRHIYSFHMPLFMMISGFFFAMTIKPGVMKKHCRKSSAAVASGNMLSFVILYAIGCISRSYTFAREHCRRIAVWFLVPEKRLCLQHTRTASISDFTQTLLDSISHYVIHKPSSLQNTGTQSSDNVSGFSARRHHMSLS